MKFKYLFVPAASLAIALAAYVRTSPARADEEVQYSCPIPTDCAAGCIKTNGTIGTPPVTPVFMKYVPTAQYIACNWSTDPVDAGKFCDGNGSPPLAPQVCGRVEFYTGANSCTGTFQGSVPYTQPGVDYNPNSGSSGFCVGSA